MPGNEDFPRDNHPKIGYNQNRKGDYGHAGRQSTLNIPQDQKRLLRDSTAEALLRLLC